MLRDASKTPHAKRRTVQVASSVAGFDPPCASEAEDALLDSYLATYGPVSLGDISWWTGWGVRRSRGALSRSSAIPCHVGGLEMSLVAHHSIERAMPESSEGRVDVLAYEDPAIKAFYESRPRYLRDVPARALFWHAGEALASVLLDGVLAATWRWDRRSRSARWAPAVTLSEKQAASISTAIRRRESWLRAQPHDPH